MRRKFPLTSLAAFVVWSCDAQGDGGGGKVPAYTWPPTVAPSFRTVEETTQPTPVKTASPSSPPTRLPTFQPTSPPSHFPTFLTVEETTAPTSSKPTSTPTNPPTFLPTHVPTLQPSIYPTSPPSVVPTSFTIEATAVPTTTPTAVVPNRTPTSAPSRNPTTQPSGQPTIVLSLRPTAMSYPTSASSNSPTSVATTKATSTSPSFLRTNVPTRSPPPSSEPTRSLWPTIERTPRPTWKPVRPSPTAPRETGDDDNDDSGNAGIFVAVMAFLFLLALCCGYNRGRAEVDNYQDAETAVDEFKEDMLHRRCLVFTTPAGSLPVPCNKDKKRITWNKRTTALFFSTRIKRRWKPMMTYCQFFFGWVAFFSTVVGFFAPENRGNSIVGCGALFINEILLHIWYGYLRYPNLVTGGEEDGFFEDIKYLFGVLYHQDTEDHSDNWVDWVCFPFTAVLHVGTLLGICGSYIACCALRTAGQDENKKRSRSQQEGDDAAANAFAILVGALVGSFAYPLLFLVAKSPIWKFVAAYAHHIVEEYYESKLFRKSGKEFLVKVIFSVLGDMVGIDGLEGINEAIEDAAEENKPELSSDDFDSQKLDVEHDNDSDHQKSLLGESTERTVTYDEEEVKEEDIIFFGNIPMDPKRFQGGDEEEVVFVGMEKQKCDFIPHDETTSEPSLADAEAAKSCTSSHMSDIEEANSSSSESSLSEGDSSSSTSASSTTLISDDDDGTYVSSTSASTCSDSSDESTSTGLPSMSTSSSKYWETDEQEDASSASLSSSSSSSSDDSSENSDSSAVSTTSTPVPSSGEGDDDDTISSF